jgi:hypothetical protein
VASSSDCEGATRLTLKTSADRAEAAAGHRYRARVHNGAGFLRISPTGATGSWRRGCCLDGSSLAGRVRCIELDLDLLNVECHEGRLRERSAADAWRDLSARGNDESREVLMVVAVMRSVYQRPTGSAM